MHQNVIYKIPCDNCDDGSLHESNKKTIKEKITGMLPILIESLNRHR